MLPKSTRDNNLFKDDIFLNQKVNFANCRQWSRHLATESRSPAQVPAAPTSSQRENKPTELSNIHLPELDLGEAEKERTVEEEKEQAGHMEELENLHKTCEKTIQSKNLEDSEDLAVLTDEPVKEVVEKDKSILRRMLNWVNKLIHDHYKKMIAETYRREREEGNQFYPSKIIL